MNRDWLLRSLSDDSCPPLAGYEHLLDALIATGLASAESVTRGDASSSDQRLEIERFVTEWQPYLFLALPMVYASALNGDTRNEHRYLMGQMVLGAAAQISLIRSLGNKRIATLNRQANLARKDQKGESVNAQLAPIFGRAYRRIASEYRSRIGREELFKEALGYLADDDPLRPYLTLNRARIWLEKHRKTLISSA